MMYILTWVTWLLESRAPVGTSWDSFLLGKSFLFVYRGVGLQAVDLILEEARRVGEGLSPTSRANIQAITNRIQADLGRYREPLDSRRRH